MQLMALARVIDTNFDIRNVEIPNFSFVDFTQTIYLVSRHLGNFILSLHFFKFPCTMYY